MKLNNRLEAYRRGLLRTNAAHAVVSRPDRWLIDINPYQHPVLRGDYDTGCHDQMAERTKHHYWEMGYSNSIRRRTDEFVRMCREVHG